MLLARSSANNFPAICTLRCYSIMSKVASSISIKGVRINAEVERTSIQGIHSYLAHHLKAGSGINHVMPPLMPGQNDTCLGLVLPGTHGIYVKSWNNPQHLCTSSCKINSELFNFILLIGVACEASQSNMIFQHYVPVGNGPARCMRHLHLTCENCSLIIVE